MTTDAERQAVEQSRIDRTWLRHAVIARALLWAQEQVIADDRTRYIYYRSTTSSTILSRESGVFADTAEAVVRDFQMGAAPEHSTLCATVWRNEHGGAEYRFHAALQVPG